MLKVISVLIIICTIWSCNKERFKLKRDLNGTYKVTEVSVDYYARGGSGCQGENVNFNHYKIQDPGKVRFTGRRPIQGSGQSITNKTYIGYFDFQYSVLDSDSNVRSQTEEVLFQYEFPEHSIGDFDTVQIHIIDENNYASDLILERKVDKIVAFKYMVFQNNCYTAYKRFELK